jgi:phospholipase A1
MAPSALLCLFALLGAMPATADDLANCARIAEPTQRLACYDSLTGKTAPAKPDSPPLNSEPVRAPDSQDSLAQQRIAQEAETLENPFSLTAHRTNYILPVTYNSKKNIEPFRSQFQASAWTTSRRSFRSASKPGSGKSLIG